MVTLHIGLSTELQAKLADRGASGIEEFATKLGVSLISEADLLEFFRHPDPG